MDDILQEVRSTEYLKVGALQLHIINDCIFSCFKHFSILGALKAGHALTSYRGMFQVFFSYNKKKKKMVSCIG